MIFVVVGAMVLLAFAYEMAWLTFRWYCVRQGVMFTLIRGTVWKLRVASTNNACRSCHSVHNWFVTPPGPASIPSRLYIRSMEASSPPARGWSLLLYVCQIYLTWTRRDPRWTMIHRPVSTTCLSCPRRGTLQASPIDEPVESVRRSYGVGFSVPVFPHYVYSANR